MKQVSEVRFLGPVPTSKRCLQTLQPDIADVVERNTRRAQNAVILAIMQVRLLPSVPVTFGDVAERLIVAVSKTVGDF